MAVTGHVLSRMLWASMLPFHEMEAFLGPRKLVLFGAGLARFKSKFSGFCVDNPKYRRIRPMQKKGKKKGHSEIEQTAPGGNDHYYSKKHRTYVTLGDSSGRQHRPAPRVSSNQVTRVQR